MAKKLVWEQLLPIKGTTKFTIGDSEYISEIERGVKDKALVESTFKGNISAAPVGIMRIREWLCTGMKGVVFTLYEVGVFTGMNMSMCETYLNGKYYDGQLKTERTLGCDHANFYVETKWGCDTFYTGSDSYYGSLLVMKQYYGMSLTLYFSGSMFDFEEIKTRMTALFPVSKNKADVEFVKNLTGEADGSSDQT